MGVYNPLVDMPVSCAECFTRGGSNCFLDQQMSYPNVLHSRHPDCPLVEVKAPHGRLKDVDAIIKEHGFEMFDHSVEVDAEYIDDAPTIIEAEGKDDASNT